MKLNCISLFSKLTVVSAMRVLLLTAVFFLTGCENKSEDKSPEKITVGIPIQPSGALTIIALKKNYFKKHRLDVTVNKYPSGKRALIDGLFTGKDDIVGAAEMPAALSFFKRKDFRIIATTFSCSDVNSIIASRKSGILKKQDLAGKRIGTQKNSAVHYFLDMFLQYNCIPVDKIEMVYMKAEELPQALADGRIEAFSMREPFIEQAKRQLKKKAML